ncbi:hypothetical protein ZWY2020_015028 [Hordeum vulgare]|nr:hypothetical protein ZWY2020_015028 [Hordeum vulgare]
MAQFDTVSNPLRTQAGDTGRAYPLNVTSDGGGRVNISTGVVNASVDGTLYTGDRLVVYQVDKVLLPWALYGPPVPAPAPSPASDKDKKKAGPVAVADSPEAVTATRPRRRPWRCGALAAVSACWLSLWRLRGVACDDRGRMADDVAMH